MIGEDVIWTGKDIKVSHYRIEKGKDTEDRGRGKTIFLGDERFFTVSLPILTNLFKNGRLPDFSNYPSKVSSRHLPDVLPYRLVVLSPSFYLFILPV
jgi:hypothetical protein